MAKAAVWTRPRRYSGIKGADGKLKLEITDDDLRRLLKEKCSTLASAFKLFDKNGDGEVRGLCTSKFSQQNVCLLFKIALDADGSELLPKHLRVLNGNVRGGRTRLNNIEYFPPHFEGLVLGCIDADFCK